MGTFNVPVPHGRRGDRRPAPLTSTGLVSHSCFGGLQAGIREPLVVVLDAVAEMPSAQSGIGLQELCGAAARVPPDATAFPHRGHHWDFLILSQRDDPADSGRNIDWSRVPVPST
jgi:hypothetical protein